MSISLADPLSYLPSPSETTSSKILVNRSNDEMLEKIDDLKRKNGRQRRDYEGNSPYGEIIEKDGVRERFNGSTFRRICSKSNCSFNIVKSGLCKKHLLEEQNQNHPATTIATASSSSLPVAQLAKATKGEVRLMENGIRMKYDGKKFRRICAENNCLSFITSLYNGNDLCLKHFNQKNPKQPVQSKPTLKKRRRRRRVPLTRRLKRQPAKPMDTNNPNLKQPKAGDITDMNDGTRRKYSGGAWRLMCIRQNCPSFAVTRRQCRKHANQDVGGGANKLNHIGKTQQSTSTSAITTTTNTLNNSILHPNKGDIQTLRQMFDGRSWHSLCRNNTCLKRATQNSGFLCAAHLKEEQQKTSGSRTTADGRKRKADGNTNENDLTNVGYNLRKAQKLGFNSSASGSHNEFVLSLNALDEQQSSARTNSSIDKTKLVEQSVQTDMTYPCETQQPQADLVLIDDEEPLPTTIQFPLYLKKEEGIDDHLLLPSTTTTTNPYYPYQDIQELKPTPDLKSEY
ncbi:unnamed protein product [Didymodactylos carnosus]|uniref:Uncharacterized protein n=1 Tax=Didymodactylos carnosus TaxID=1234261 RepID=A0A813PD95_9BILA|nr:unnamed protein product [Didymodactylos carnosus]CAF0897804.1 unnamed protein product [Didymodactylos carnosus]CAF3532371.1 unnamed protein product [Didymodactylos carnosus]CAF3678975.1 unnamed protein product [Didymodactylos carnosus]